MKKRVLKIMLLLLLTLVVAIIPMNSVKAANILPTATDNLRIGLRSKSALVATSSGYMRVFYDEKKICIEYYDNNFNIQSKKSVTMELSLWGGFYAGQNAYYVVEGQNNKDEKNDAEVIRVIKYDTNWKRLGAAKITSNTKLSIGGEVRYPFDVGCVEMAENNGYLYVVTGHEGYVDKEIGQGHQGFLMIKVNEASMTGELVDSDLWHSFAQYIKYKDSNLYVLEQSEGSGFTKLSKYNEKDLSSKSIAVFRYGGDRSGTWATACYASVDDMAISSNNVLCLGTSIDQSKYDVAVKEGIAHNIYLTVTPMNNFSESATVKKQITNYSDKNKSFLGTKITKINDNRFMISWEEYNTSQTASIDDTLSGYVLHYIFVDANGNKIGKEYKVAAPISDCHPIVKGSKIVYYASSDNMVNFYSIDANNGNFSKKAYRIAGENVTWELKNGVLTFSGNNAINYDVKGKYRSPISSVGGYVYYTENSWGPIKEKVKSIVIKKGITSICDEAFSNFENLTEVKIEDGLKSIGKKAFYSCSSLDNITIPSSVTSLGEDCLWSGWYSYSDERIVYVTINAASNSYAIKYAKQNNIDFKLTDNAKFNISITKISNIPDQTYTGYNIYPTVTIKDVNFKLYSGTDYTISSYLNNKDVGTATIKITGKGIYTGTVSKTFKIVPKKINGYKINNIPAQTYTGNNKKPTVTISGLRNGTDYKVTTYKNNRNPGKATAVVTGKGNYTGTLTKTFIIKPAKVEKLKVSKVSNDAVKVSWSKATGVTGYKVYQYNYSKKKWEYVGKTTSTKYTIKKLKAGTVCKFRVRAYKTIDKVQYFGKYSSSLKTSTAPITTKITKISTKNKKVTLKWNKVTNATGYQIYMSTSKNGKYTKIKTIKNIKTVSYTKGSLKKGKKYYFKIRVYTSVDTGRVYSSYCKVKNIKIK